MNESGYYQPENCRLGEIYFIQEKKNSTEKSFKEVEFLSYRPHPGELVIKEDGVARIIHRRLLFSRVANDQKN